MTDAGVSRVIDVERNSDVETIVIKGNSGVWKLWGVQRVKETVLCAERFVDVQGLCGVDSCFAADAALG